VGLRWVANAHRVMLGEQTEYEPLCRNCFQKAIREEK